MGRSRRLDSSEIEGKCTTKHFDPRISYQPIDPTMRKYIEPGADGVTPVIPVEHVEQVLVENEHLRDELYTKQNTEFHRAMSHMQTFTGQTTSEVIKRVSHIERHSGMTMNQQIIFRLVYKIMSSITYNDYKSKAFKQKPQESKLRMFWRLGYLPFISFIVVILDETIRYMYKCAPVEMHKVYDKIASKSKKKQKKP